MYSKTPIESKSAWLTISILLYPGLRETPIWESEFSKNIEFLTFFWPIFGGALQYLQGIRQLDASRSSQFSSKSTTSNYHICLDKRELVLSPYKAAAIWQHFDWKFLR